MAQIMGWRIILGLTAAGFLAACVETTGTSDGAAAGPTGGTTGKVRAGAEVEAPEVFSANESALWDGRPSLGGIWVASPDAVDPERVVMFNPATGKTVKGALFRRERDNPGPRLQLSSDAAEALGVLAGMPTEIQVTALRKQEVVEETPAEVVEPAADDAAAAETATPEAAEAGTDAAAVAAAALDAVDAGADGAAATGEAAVADATATDPAAMTEEPPKKTWKEKRAEAKAAREAKKAAAAAAAAAAAGEAVVVEGEAAPTAESAGVEEIESAPLDARKPEVAVGEAEPEKPAASDAGTAVVEAPATAEPSAGARTIQIASFSKEDNAKRAVEALAKIGIAARAQKLDKNGKVVWGVVASGDEATLKQIKDAGFADAYFLK